MIENCCAFTGHRLLGDDFDAGLLERVIEGLIKRGTDTFYCGMAKGFDLVAGETVIRLKKRYDVKLIACIPYAGQAERMNEENKKRYMAVLENCSERMVFSDKYNFWCMHARDRYMAENSGTVVCYLRKQSGGTYYTVNYARALGRKIIEV